MCLLIFAVLLAPWLLTREAQIVLPAHSKGNANGFPSLSLPGCGKTANLINPGQMGTSLVSLKVMFSIIVYDTTCYRLVIFPVADHQSTVKHCS